jgi:hypothetical protein
MPEHDVEAAAAGHQAERGRVVGHGSGAIVMGQGGTAHAAGDRAVALHQHAVGGQREAGQSHACRGQRGREFLELHRVLLRRG